MKGAAHRWIAVNVAAMSFIMLAGAARAADVTDADRSFRNFTRETATVSDGQVRIETRGLFLQDEENTRLNLLGILQPRDQVKSVNGGVVDLLTSYGFTKNMEAGLDIPGIIESKRIEGRTINNADIGDLLLYGKFKQSVAEHCAVGAGIELTLPNGPEHKGFGTGELGVTPNVSTRYQRGPWGVGANVGYTTYTGDPHDVFNYGAEVFLRGSETYAIRTEIAGRVFNQRGTRWHDLTIMPGIDFNLSDNIVLRPTGLANATDTALDWGIGLGIAMSFAAPPLAFPHAAPPPPAAPAPAPVAQLPPPTEVRIVLRGVHFDFNKSVIRADAAPVLDQAVVTLKEHSAISITTEGHTDSVGSDEYNQRLSLRRATAVRDYLVAHGIDAGRMTVVGQGESHPVATNDTDDGRAQNRRVELLVAP